MKYYIDVQIDGNGQITIDSLALTLRGIVPATVNIEIVENVGGTPENFIRITYEAHPAAADELVAKIKNVPGSWVPARPRAAHPVS